MNIYVAKLDFETQSEDLIKVFTQYGEVTSANVIKDKMTGRSRGFAFVEMKNDEEAKKAIEELHDSILLGRNIIVKEAQPRNERRPPQNNWKS